jgi:hypothetical protein
MPSSFAAGRSARRYGIADVLGTERRAWAEGPGVYHFDGICFWRREAATWVAAREGAVPRDGWWHALTCNCRLCRAEAE